MRNSGETARGPIVVEFTGAQGSGKTSLLALTQESLRARGFNGMHARAMPLIIIQRSALGRAVRFLPARYQRPALRGLARLAEAFYRPAFVLAHPRLAWEALAILRRHRTPRRERRLFWRHFLTNAGHRQLFQRHHGARDVLLFPEGFTHRALDLFRRRSEVEAWDRQGIARYLALTPVAELTVLVRAPLDLCLRRVRDRGRRSPNLLGKSEAQLTHFVSDSAQIAEWACSDLSGAGWRVVSVDNAGELGDCLPAIAEAMDSILPPHLEKDDSPSPAAIPHPDNAALRAPADARQPLGKRQVYLQVLPRLIVGGAEQVVCDLARSVDPSRFEAVTLCISGKGPLQAQLEAAGLEVVQWQFGRNPITRFPRWLSDHTRLFRQVAALVRERRVAIVQTQLLGPRHALVALAARWGGAPVVVWNFRNERFLRGGWFGLKPKVWAAVFRLGSALVDHIVAVSEETRAGLIRQAGIAPSKITVINNGIDSRRMSVAADPRAIRVELGFGPEARLILTVATLKRQKGHEVLLRAAPRVVARCPGARFLIAGDGVLRAELEALARNLGLGAHVRFLGTRRDVPALLAASDLFVLPSLWEGLPNALLEAMAAGRPIVATAVSGVGEVMEDGVEGRVVPPGDPSALAEAIEDLLGDPRRAAAMASAARERALSEHGFERVARGYQELFERLIARRTGGVGSFIPPPLGPEPASPRAER